MTQTPSVHNDTSSSPQPLKSSAEITGDEEDLTITDSRYDRFGPPAIKKQRQCVPHGAQCSVPGVRLDTGRLRWKSYVGDDSQSDGVYLLSSARTLGPRSVDGTARTGSALSDFGF